MVILQLEEQPAIIQAIFAGAVDEVRELISYKQDINCFDCGKRTPLHAAAFKGDLVISSLLLQNGARVNAKDGEWITPLHRACSVGSEEAVSLLLSYQADINARDKLWQTPLHIAAANDAYNCVEQLLNHVPNPNITDRSGRTALHHAAYNETKNVAELLISRGCIVNACDKKDWRPLHCAVQMGHDDTVELLLKSGADINAKDRNQYTPLHVAAASGIESVCRLLLEAGAEVDAQNVYGNTPLHIACLNGHLKVCQELVEYNANKEASNFRGQTPLHIAAASTNGVDCLMFLLRQKEVDINRQSLDGRTPLHMTAIHGRFTRSKTLIDKGALIDCADKNGCTPLHIAAQYGHDLLANTLLTYGANPSKKGYEGRTPLHMCCLSGYVECGRKFVQCGVDLNDRDDTGKTPTHCAAYKGSYECLDLLVSNGADFKLLDNLQRLPIHYAASQGHYQCVFTLVGIGSSVNVPDVEGCTPLHLAAAYDHEGKCVEYLLDHKADPTMRDNRGFAPLHYAIAGGNVNSVSLLLNYERKTNEHNNRQECGEGRKNFEKDTLDITSLHLAATLGNIDILRMIMPYCNDVNIRTKQGITPLILAAREGHAQCVQFLLRFGAKVALADDLNNMTPVHYSAKNGHSQCLTLLLHNSEDQGVVNMLDKQNRTALMLAVSGNHIECVQTLLKCGADPNIVDTDEHSCLFRAVVNGQNSVVQLLLSSNAKVQATDVNGKTVLHLAAACGHFVCMQMIMSYMTEEEAQVKDNQDCTALHWACYNGHSNCVEYLLERDIFKKLEGNSFSPLHCATFSGSEKCIELLVNHFGSQIVHLTDCRKRTPLHIAALHGHVECAKFLIDQGADVQVFDDEGRTPFIAASQYGQLQIIELLLTCKIDRTSCDILGNTALHWACLKKHNQTALLILEDSLGDSTIGIANNDGKTPLHISARNGLVDVTRELLKKGASVLAVDNEGLTPALCCAPNNNVAQCLALILQSLPQFLDSRSSTSDFLNLTPFYQNMNQSKSKCEQRDVHAQTPVSLIQNPHKLQLRKIPPKSPKKSVTSNQNLIVDDRDIFLLENKDFHEDATAEEVPEESGLTLHKSCGDISLVACKKIKKQCRECFRLQHRCSECSMKTILRKHLTGKTTQQEFNDFVSRCFTEPSSEYRRVFNAALEDIGEEFGLNQKDSKSTQIGQHLMLLNKNREIFGRRQNISKLRGVRKKLTHNEDEKTYKKMLQEKTDVSCKFIVDKDDPVLIGVAENETSALKVDETIKETLCENSQTDLLELLPKLPMELSKEAQTPQNSLSITNLPPVYHNFNSFKFESNECDLNCAGTSEAQCEAEIKGNLTTKEGAEGDTVEVEPQIKENLRKNADIIKDPVVVEPEIKENLTKDEGAMEDSVVDEPEIKENLAKNQDTLKDSVIVERVIEESLAKTQGGIKDSAMIEPEIKQNLAKNGGGGKDSVVVEPEIKENLTKNKDTLKDSVLVESVIKESLTKKQGGMKNSAIVEAEIKESCVKNQVTLKDSINGEPVIKEILAKNQVGIKDSAIVEPETEENLSKNEDSVIVEPEIKDLPKNEDTFMDCLVVEPANDTLGTNHPIEHKDLVLWESDPNSLSEKPKKSPTLDLKKKRSRTEISCTVS